MELSTEIQFLFGIVTGGLIIGSMVFRKVRLIKTIALMSSVWDFSVGLIIGSAPMMGINSVTSMVCSKELSTGWLYSLLRKYLIPIAYTGVAVWTCYDLFTAFSPTALVGWINTWLVIACFSCSTERNIKLFMAGAGIMGFCYGLMLGYYPLCVVKFLVLCTVVPRLIQMKLNGEWNNAK